MQAATLLNPMSAANTAGAGNPTSIFAGEGASGDPLFAQLLGDLSADGDGQGTSAFPQGQILPSAAKGALLAAQGLTLVAMPAAATQQDLGQTITLDEATAMLARLDGFLRHQGYDGHEQSPQGHPMLERLRPPLQQIVDSETPKTLGEVLAAASDGKEPQLVALLSGLVKAVKKAVQAKDEQEEETSGPLLSQLQQLPATMFHADHAARKGTTGTAVAEKRKDREFVETVTVVSPVAFHAIDSIEVADAPRLRNLDDLIPPLTPVQEEKQASEKGADLPDVDLPRLVTNPVRDAAETLQAMRQTAREDSGTMLATGDIGVAEGVHPAHAVTASQGTHGHAMRTIDLTPTPGFINHAPVKEQVQVAISQAAKDGLDKITIQLEPVELGRIEINMHTSKEGVTQLFFMVDKPETFDSLSRDARLLERSLQEAGIKADTGSMQFNLRQQPQPQMQSDMSGQGQRSPQPPEEEQAAQHGTLSSVESLAAFTRHYTINIRDGVDISA